MNRMKAIIAVNTKKGFKLELKFNTGEIKLFDATPYLEKGVFKKLKDEALFKQAFVAFDTVCWPNNLDISPETLYDKSVVLG
jgi:hypothetical protein